MKNKKLRTPIFYHRRIFAPEQKKNFGPVQNEDFGPEKNGPEKKFREKNFLTRNEFEIKSSIFFSRWDFEAKKIFSNLRMKNKIELQPFLQFFLKTLKFKTGVNFYGKITAQLLYCNESLLFRAQIFQQ